MKYYIFFKNFAPNPMKIKLIPRQIEENRIYERFCRKTWFGSYKMLQETKDSIKLVISNVIDDQFGRTFYFILV